MTDIGTGDVHLVEGNSGDDAETNLGHRRRRQLSFTGIMDAEPDLAARSEEILLREEFGRPTSLSSDHFEVQSGP